MNLSSAKIIAILGLSIILTNSGVAWALQHCLTDNEAGDYIHLALTASARPTSKREYSAPAVVVEHRHQAASRIHCTENPVLKLWFGPVANVFRLEPPRDDALSAFLPDELLNASASALTGSVPVPIHLLVTLRLSPHLFFPRFRI